MVKRIKEHPLGKIKLKTVTSEHMQEYLDFLSFGGKASDGTEASTAKGCAGAVRTLGSKYHNEYLRPRYKGSQEKFSKTLG